MNIYVCDTAFKRIGLIDSYKSFIWTDRYNSFGDFEIEFTPSNELLDLFRVERYLEIDFSDRYMIIEKLSYSEKEDESDSRNLIVSGRSVESILDRRIIWNYTNIDTDIQTAIERLLNENVINPVDQSRKIDGFRMQLSTDSRITNSTMTAQYYGNDLYEVIFDICNMFGVGFKLIPIDGKLVFSLYIGENRTKEQIKNPYVIFSKSFDSVLDSDYFYSLESFKNVVLISSKETDGTTNEIIVGRSGGESGLYRREIFEEVIGASKTDESGQPIPEDVYYDLLVQKGNEVLYDNSVVSDFDGEIKTNGIYQYNRDFYLGDIVQIQNDFGLYVNSRVTEVIISNNDEGLTIYPTFSSIE